MAKNFLTPIDLNALEIQNFLVHNVSTLPTAEPGRLVIHDNVLKFGYTSGGTKKWATLLDSSNYNMSEYWKEADAKTYLTSNFLQTSAIGSLVAAYSHTHTVSDITNWSEAWKTQFDGNGGVTKTYLETNYYTGDSVDTAVNSAKYQATTRVFRNPTKVSGVTETMNSATATGGTICFNTSTGHVLYKVSNTYYAGSFPDSEFFNYVRSAQKGDIVIFDDTDVMQFYLNVDGLNFVKVHDKAEITALETKISNIEGGNSGVYAKASEVYTKTEVDTKVGERLLTTTFNSYKSSTDSSISTLNSWKSTASNQISALESWKTSASATLEILTGSSDSNGTINKWKELEAFLSGFSDSESATLKTQLDAKVAKGPKSSTSGIASATTYTPTLGTMTVSSKSGKAYRRLTVDANGDLSSEIYKVVIDFTVGSGNTSTYIQMTNTAFLNAFGTTAGTNGFQELTVQVYKQDSTSYNEVGVDVRQDTAGIVLTWGIAPKSGTYRVIVIK